MYKIPALRTVNAFAKITSTTSARGVFHSDYDGILSRRQGTRIYKVTCFLLGFFICAIERRPRKSH